MPGAGQWLNGQGGLGAALLVAALLSDIVAIRAVLSPVSSFSVAAIAMTLAVAIPLGSVIHAYLRARARGPGPPATAWRAAFWSRLVPGLGQIIERRLVVGIPLLLAALATGGPDKTGFVRTIGSAIAVFAFWEALLRSRTGPADPRRARVAIAVVAVFELCGAILPGIVRGRVQAFRNPSAGMRPTLEAGDHLFVDRTRAGRARAGDLVAFRYAPDRTQTFIKRCVATAGQTVLLRDRRLIVDRTPVPEPYAEHTDPVLYPAEQAPRDNFGPFIVPRGQVFVLGDSRERSNDSRYFGGVPLSDVLGRAMKIYWPPSRWGPLPHGAD